MTLQFGHLVLRTPRRAEMVEWYCAILEARVVEVRDEVTFTSYDDAHHRIAFVEDRRPIDGSRLAHLAFAYSTLDELAGAYRRLAAHRIHPARMVDHHMSWSLYYRDPDDGEVELFTAAN